MKYIRAFSLLVGFVVHYVVVLVQSNLRITWDILTPGLQIQPGFIIVAMRTQNDFETLVLVNLIAMTPGTLSMDISQDRKFIYLHVMYLNDVEQMRKEVSIDLQDRVLGVIRAWR